MNSPVHFFRKILPGKKIHFYGKNIFSCYRLAWRCVCLSCRLYVPTPVPASRRPTPSLCTFTVLFMLQIGLEVCVFVLPSICPHTSSCQPTPDSLIVYIYCGLWLVTLLLDRYYRHQHNKSRLAGYLEFYRRTRNIRRMPFFVNCVGKICLIMR